MGLFNFNNQCIDIIVSYFFIIIIIMIIYNYVYNNNNNSVSSILSSCKNTNIKQTIESFVNPQYELYDVFRNYSSNNKVILNGNCKQEYFTNDILSEKDKESIQKITQFILQDISNLNQNRRFNINNNGVYNFKEINKVLIETNLMGKRYVIDTFVYDVRNFYSIRILIDYVIIEKNVFFNSIRLYDGANNNIINRYDTVINRIGVLNDTNQFTENWLSYLDKTYSDKYTLYGTEDNTIEYSKLTQEIHNIKKLGIDSYGKLLLPTYIDNNKTIKPTSSLFCKAQEIFWDWTSAYKPSKNVPSNCLLHNSATIAQANIPYYTPSTFAHTNIHKGN
jgi:hypothetical protein